MTITDNESRYDRKAICRWMDRFHDGKTPGGRFTPKPLSAPVDISTEQIQENQEQDYSVEEAYDSPDQELLSATETKDDSMDPADDIQHIIGQKMPEQRPFTDQDNEPNAMEKQRYEDLQYTIMYYGMIPLLKIELDPGAELKAESGAMVAMSDTVKMTGKMDGGLGKALVRKMFSKEKFFFQKFKSEEHPGEVYLAPSTIGDIAVIELDGGHGYCLQKDGYLASTKKIEVGTKMQSLTKGLFSGEGFFIVGIKGRGLLFCNAFGSIHKIQVPQGRSYIIDNKHLVAWTSDMHYAINPSSGMISTFTSGEVLICRFDGPGTLYIQSRNPDAFTEWISAIAKKQQAKSKSRNSK